MNDNEGDIQIRQGARQGELARKPYTGIGSGIADMTSNELDDYVDRLYRMEQAAGMDNTRDEIYARIQQLRDEQQKFTDVAGVVAEEIDKFVDPRLTVRDTRKD